MILQGLVRRRVLVNYRIDPDVAQRWLPQPFRPKLVNGWAIAGICLIRLEQLRPTGLPTLLGLSSENAAHRIAVTWFDGDGSQCDGVYIPRRDTSSCLNAAAAGRLVPGQQRLARFSVSATGASFDLTLRTADGRADVRLIAREATALPVSSCFADVKAASDFFAGGSVGYSPDRDASVLTGLQLRTRRWNIQPLDVQLVSSAYFEDTERSPAGLVTFDSALVMRDIPHEWHPLPRLALTA